VGLYKYKVLGRNKGELGGKGGKAKKVYTTASWFFVPSAATDGRVAGTCLAGDSASLQVQHGSRVAGITAPYAPQSVLRNNTNNYNNVHLSFKHKGNITSTLTRL
jgi:hypothetical protein